MRVALTRAVSTAMDRCELTHLGRTQIDTALAARQHARVEECLRELDCDVRRVPADPDWPDAVFIEDTCFVVDELAVIARPGAASRRAETAAVADALRPMRELRFIEPPGTLDGGDVVRLGRRVFVGLSGRTNRAGVEQIRSFLAPHGYDVVAADVTGCLHLKTAATAVGDNTVLVNPAWVNRAVFAARVVEVEPAEPFGANAMLVGDTAVYPAAFPETRRRLELAGVRVVPIDLSELAKAEGGVTCCAVVFEAAG